MATTGHESEAINVQGLKASLQKLKTDHIDGKADEATTLAGYGITDAYTKTEVNGLVDTPHQNYVTVSATSQTTAATDVLPNSGQSADTIYRVSNWDGSANSGAGAFDVSCYSEYAWDDASNPNKYVFLCVKSQIGEVFDISVYNNNAKYADLAAALNGGANIPQSLQKGGMSVKFVQSSDNNYVQYRLMLSTFTAAQFVNPANWQGVDSKPIPESKNMVESGSVYYVSELNDITFNAGKKFADMKESNIYFSDGVVRYNEYSRCKLFPAIGIKHLTVTANASQVAYVAYISDISTVTPSFTRSEIPIGQKRLINIPSGTQYIAINMVSYDQINYAPASVDIEYLSDSVVKADNLAILPNIGTSLLRNNTYIISNISLKKHHNYKIYIWSSDTYTHTAECNLKIVNASSDTTVLKLFNFQNVEINTTKKEIDFTWQFDDVDGYRLGWGLGNSSTNVVFFAEILDVTVDVASDITKEFEQPCIGFSTLSNNVYPITGITLKRGHRYKVSVWSNGTFTKTSELNLKVVDSSANTTILKIYDFKNTEFSPTKRDVVFSWDLATVNNYRIGWYGATTDYIVYVSVVDITDEYVNKVVFDELLYPNSKTISISSGTFQANTNLVLKKDYKYRICLSADTDVTIPANDGKSTQINIKNSFGTTLKQLNFPNGETMGPNTVIPLDFVWDNDTIEGGYISVWSNRTITPKVTLTILLLGYMEIQFHNEILAYAAKKRMLTSAEQSAIGLTPSVHYNDCKAPQIVHVTDVHADTDRFERAIAFSNKIAASYFINSGDFVLSTGTAEITWMDNQIAELEGNYIHCIGNHDSWGVATDALLAQKYITPYASEHGWTLPSGVSNPTFFYKDDADQKIRFISLNQWVKYGDGSGYNVYHGQDQIDFLISTLQATPSDYGVVIVMHSPDRVLEATPNYTKFFQQKSYSDGIGLNGITPISTIVDAWLSKTSIDTTMTEANGDVLTINADFTSVTNAEFIAYICGHTHRDAVCYLPNTANTQLVLCNTLTSAQYIESGTANELAEDSDLARVEGTELQDAFNVYTIFRDSKTVKVVRIGSDMPYDFSERRDCMVIPYA